jgi:hypothetical protein
MAQSGKRQTALELAHQSIDKCTTATDIGFCKSPMAAAATAAAASRVICSVLYIVYLESRSFVFLRNYLPKRAEARSATVPLDSRGVVTGVVPPTCGLSR